MKILEELDEEWERLLAEGGYQGSRAHYYFDAQFYANRHSDLRDTWGPVSEETLPRYVAHYANHGIAEGRAGCWSDTLKLEDDELVRRTLAITGDEGLRGIVERHGALGAKFALELFRTAPGLERRYSTFSSEYYLRRSPDLRKVNIQPLDHYIRFGIRERRPSLSSLLERVYEGGRTHDAAKPTILLCLHELTLTGAPLVGLELAERASEGHNVVAVAPRDGALHDALLKHCTRLIVSTDLVTDMEFLPGAPIEPDLAIVNSIESFLYIPYAVAHGIPVVSCIHEFPEYTFPDYKIVVTLLYSDLVLLSSHSSLARWSPWLRELGVADADVRIIPQRELAKETRPLGTEAQARERIASALGIDLGRRRIIYGAGFVHIRKGTDLFVAVAQEAAQGPTAPIFIWIGDGLDEADFHYGLWLNLQIQLAQAAKPFPYLFFLPSGPLYRDVVTAADTLFVSSRSDPLPNIVFDAHAAGKDVVLFEGATGYDDALYQRDPLFHYVPGCDVGGAARKLLDLRRPSLKSLVGSVAKPLRLGAPDQSGVAQSSLFAQVTSFLGFEAAHPRYGEAPDELPRDGFDGSAMFDPDQREFRARERQRLRLLERRYLWDTLENAQKRAATVRGTNARVLDVTNVAAPDVGSEVEPGDALHVHAYYDDDLPYIAELPGIARFGQIVVTVRESADAEKVAALMARQPGTVRVVKVPNRGRDVAPFFAAMRAVDDASPRNWVHVHLKRSTASATDGLRWRNFLIEGLLGDPGYARCRAEIERDGVGLVAPLDAYDLPWGRSRKFHDESRFSHLEFDPTGPGPFPIGNMFWVRAEVATAMAAIFGPNFPWPSEPLPNDGTLLHFIERIWPHVAHAKGLESVFLIDHHRTRG